MNRVFKGVFYFLLTPLPFLLLLSAGCTVPIGGENSPRLTLQPHHDVVETWETRTAAEMPLDRTLAEDLGVRLTLSLVPEETDRYNRQRRYMQWMANYLEADFESDLDSEFLRAPPPVKTGGP